MSKHTPGPWSIGAIRMASVIQSWNEHFVHVGKPGVDGGQGNVIAVVHMGGNGAASNTPTDIEANALLIAAAPDLLEALKAAPLPSSMGDAAEHYRRFYDWYEHTAKQAIAKAEGGAK